MIRIPIRRIILGRFIYLTSKTQKTPIGSLLNALITTEKPSPKTIKDITEILERRFHFDPSDEVIRLIDLLFDLPDKFCHTVLYDLDPSVERACSHFLTRVRPYAVLKTDTAEVLERLVRVIDQRLTEKKNEDSDSFATSAGL